MYSTSKKNWLKFALDGRFIKFFSYNSFENFQPIERGGYGTVTKAYLKSAEKTIALKSLHNGPVHNDDKTFEEFVRELQNISAVNHHDNMITFFGISQDPNTETYFMVLQYANGGNLRNYLYKNFSKLDWKTKVKMAKDIASGLNCIHEENIVHRDLHSKNVLLHDGRLLIADLGLSKSLDTNSGSLEVISGIREPPINGTPLDYMAIYRKSWCDNPAERLTITEVRNFLDNIRYEPVFNSMNSSTLESLNMNNPVIESLDSIVNLTIDDIPTNSQEYNDYTSNNTCEESLKKVKEIYPSYMDFANEEGQCEAHIHVAVGDIQGLKWHLDRGSKTNGEFGKCNRKLYNIALHYCYSMDILPMLKTLESYGTNFANEPVLLHQLFFNKFLKPKEKILDLKNIISWLISKGFDINSKHGTKFTPLEWLVWYYDDIVPKLDAISIYLEFGADPKFPTNSNYPDLLFFLISWDCDIEFLRLILQYEIDFTMKNKMGLNALGWATHYKNISIMKYLLENVPEYSEEKSIKEAINQTSLFSEERKYLKSWQGKSGEVKKLQAQLNKIQRSK
ncbi:2778_t:CDS:2 [Cetraspora pellucida]|uniref:2778_t:CDS:1 n=1 Tax=Cetraspora pellucida TaxID=1433469 RepID=A0ACA9K846_9GLOM|nr:2778_t:CDS:2 [Cetraspora pellucida]